MDLKLNLGDSHAFGQHPITFVRQVLALCLLPELMDKDDFPDDVKRRAKRILSGCCGGAIGKEFCINIKMFVFKMYLLEQNF